MMTVICSQARQLLTHDAVVAWECSLADFLISIRELSWKRIDFKRTILTSPRSV